MAGGLVGSAALARHLQAQPTAEPPLPGQPKLHAVSQGPGFGNRIAITFDDGPNPGVTEIVLKELEARKLHATFFMIGRNAEHFPSLAKEVADAGHEIANHSYTHPALGLMSEEKVEYEIQKAQDCIVQATGKIPVWFRPPYGSFHPNQYHIPYSKNLGIALWSIDPRDWSQPGTEAITSRVVGGTTPGSIILLHDLHHQTALALPAILDGLQEKDFNFSPMSGFLGLPYSNNHLVAKAT